MASGTDDLPAILGGHPAWPEGPPGWPIRRPQIRQVFHHLLADGSWGKYHGPYADRLASELCQYHSVEQAILCSSGTAAIELALRGLKIGPGDEVVLAGYDFKGNFMNVACLGARPVLVDIDPQSFQLAPEAIEEAIGAQTRAIIATHLHGACVPMSRVMHIARSRQLPVIEDACQMPGALVEGKRAGTWGDAGVLSFGGSKLLTAGRGGALLSNDPAIVQRIRLHTQRGNEAYPLSEMQAAIVLPQLRSLDADNVVRGQSAATLRQALGEATGLVSFQQALLATQPGYYKLGLTFLRERFQPLTREEFVVAVRAEGIAMDVGFRALHRIHSARRFRQLGGLPAASYADESLLVLHHPVLLGQESDMHRIVAAVRRILHHAPVIHDTLKSTVPGAEANRNV